MPLVIQLSNIINKGNQLVIFKFDTYMNHRTKLPILVLIKKKGIQKIFIF